MIFQLAICDLPGDRPPNSAIDDLSTMARFYREPPGYSSAMKVKLSLVSVSKYWRNIAIPLLYVNYESVRLLAESLRRSVSDFPSYGIHTKGLSIVVDKDTIDRETEGDFLPRGVQCFDSILNNCENLCYFRIVDFHPRPRVDISVELSEVRAKSLNSVLLRYCNWSRTLSLLLARH
jgi:hypothetical protein